MSTLTFSIQRSRIGEK